MANVAQSKSIFAKTILFFFSFSPVSIKPLDFASPRSLFPASFASSSPPSLKRPLLPTPPGGKARVGKCNSTTISSSLCPCKSDKHVSNPMPEDHPVTKYATLLPLGFRFGGTPFSRPFFFFSRAYSRRRERFQRRRTCRRFETNICSAYARNHANKCTIFRTLHTDEGENFVIVRFFLASFYVCVCIHTRVHTFCE